MAKTTRNKHFSLKYRAFALLYRKFQLPLMKFLVKKTGGDVEAAEEVFSRTVEAALKGYDTFENRSTYFTWICKIALNKLADYYRSQINERSRWVSPLLEEVSKIKDKNLTPEERLALKELRQSVKNCLLTLPEKKRQLLYLRYWEDMTIQKIAEVTGKSQRSVEGKLYRAKVELRAVYANSYPEYRTKQQF